MERAPATPVKVVPPEGIVIVLVGLVFPLAPESVQYRKGEVEEEAVRLTCVPTTPYTVVEANPFPA